MRHHCEKQVPVDSGSTTITRRLLLEQYLSQRLGGDLLMAKAGRVTVIESPLRTRQDGLYPFIRSVWWIWLPDGRSLLSVPPGTGDLAREFAARLMSMQALCDPQVGAHLLAALTPSLADCGLPVPGQSYGDLCFAWDGTILPDLPANRCMLVREAACPLTAGLRFPPPCDPHGLSYAYVEDGQIVSIAFAHRTGVMEEAVAEVGVVTTAPYRRRGYAKAAVAALVAQMGRQHGVARYVCLPGNAPSVAIARSVGFVPYGTSLQFLHRLT